MGKIAAELDRAVTRRRAAGTPGGTAGARLAAGAGWSAHDVLCTHGPGDRPFEERHGAVAVAVVIAGSFGYRTPSGEAVMTPGCLMLGNAGQPFECGHAHAAGDRCVAFRYDPEFFERLAAEAGAARGARRFGTGRLPPLRETAGLVARATIGVAVTRSPASQPAAWEELALEVAAAAIRIGSGRTAPLPASAHMVARVTRSVRDIARDPAARVPLARLAADAGVSPFHYLRTFREVTGVTPHQYRLRARLREAAARLAEADTRVIDVAFDAGFRDVSTFNRTFRAEFGMPPGTYRVASLRAAAVRR